MDRAIGTKYEFRSRTYEDHDGFDAKSTNSWSCRHTEHLGRHFFVDLQDDKVMSIDFEDSEEAARSIMFGHNYFLDEQLYIRLAHDFQELQEQSKAEWITMAKQRRKDELKHWVTRTDEGGLVVVL